MVCGHAQVVRGSVVSLDADRGSSVELQVERADLGAGGCCHVSKSFSLQPPGAVGPDVFPSPPLEVLRPSFQFVHRPTVAVAGTPPTPCVPPLGFHRGRAATYAGGCLERRVEAVSSVPVPHRPMQTSSAMRACDPFSNKPVLRCARGVPEGGNVQGPGFAPGSCNWRQPLQPAASDVGRVISTAPSPRRPQASPSSSNTFSNSVTSLPSPGDRLFSPRGFPGQHVKNQTVAPCHPVPQQVASQVVSQPIPHHPEQREVPKTPLDKIRDALAELEAVPTSKTISTAGLVTSPNTDSSQQSLQMSTVPRGDQSTLPALPVDVEKAVLVQELIAARAVAKDANLRIETAESRAKAEVSSGRASIAGLEFELAKVQESAAATFSARSDSRREARRCVKETSEIENLRDELAVARAAQAWKDRQWLHECTVVAELQQLWEDSQARAGRHAKNNLALRGEVELFEHRLFEERSKWQEHRCQQEPLHSIKMASSRRSSISISHPTDQNEVASCTDGSVWSSTADLTNG